MLAISNNFFRVSLLFHYYKVLENAEFLSFVLPRFFYEPENRLLQLTRKFGREFYRKNMYEKVLMEYDFEV